MPPRARVCHGHVLGMVVSFLPRIFLPFRVRAVRVGGKMSPDTRWVRRRCLVICYPPRDGDVDVRGIRKSWSRREAPWNLDEARWVFAGPYPPRRKGGPRVCSSFLCTLENRAAQVHLVILRRSPGTGMIGLSRRGARWTTDCAFRAGGSSLCPLPLPWPIPNCTDLRCTPATYRQLGIIPALYLP